MDLTMSKTNQDLKQKYDEVFKKGSENFFTSNGFEESLGIIQMLNDWGNLEVSKSFMKFLSIVSNQTEF
mgnify:CR=1 FL=1